MWTSSRRRCRRAAAAPESPAVSVAPESPDFVNHAPGSSTPQPTRVICSVDRGGSDGIGPGKTLPGLKPNTIFDPSEICSRAGKNHVDWTGTPSEKA